MILAVGHTKGGVGKSTIAVQLATYLKSVRNIDKLWVIDTDPQKSLSFSFMERNSSENKKIPPISCASYSNSKELRQQIIANKDYWDQIIIDAGGRDTQAFRTALLLADELLIPMVPRSYDLLALNDLYSVLEDAWGVGSAVKAKIFLSCADTNNKTNEEAIEYIRQFKNLEYIDAPVFRRKQTGLASAMGLSVFEYPPKNDKACNEIEQLAKVIYGE